MQAHQQMQGGSAGKGLHTRATGSAPVMRPWCANSALGRLGFSRRLYMCTCGGTGAPLAGVEVSGAYASAAHRSACAERLIAPR